MEKREKRFVQLGVVGRSLEDPSERDALMDFFANVQLPAEITRKTITELIVVELKNHKLIGGSVRFQELSAGNKVSLDNIKRVFEGTFRRKMNKVRNKIIDELHRAARRRFPRRRVQIRGLNDLFQADLVDLRKLASLNKGYKYILFVINAFSKYAWAEPLKTKSGSEVTEVMSKILDRTTAPRNLQVDAGKEFYNESFQNLMEKRGINMYSTYSRLVWSKD